ncbi:bile acid:sodium symporter family protein [Cesiribacter sp. SM1]|uniref:bile acid:sodium symporter family protein n=1 Tax=Cesiribacter sp. SM1 TaxID=2861196 RepID=UPI001CD4CB11
MKSIFSFVKIDRFVLAILCTVLLAYLFPGFGSDDSPIPLDTISSIGVSLIFFFYGLKLSPEKIKLGLKNWKLHLVIQSTTFLIFPLLVLLFHPFLQGEQQETIWLSMFFLAALPSTVSSSVVMVSIAKGNIPAAIFNASISGIIGIVLTPLWMGLFLQSQEEGAFDFTQIYGKLLLEILLPVVLGILMQRKGHWLAVKYSKELSLFDRAVILLIVYKSFAESFAGGAFSAIGAADLVVIVLLVLALFFAVYGVVYWITTLLSFSLEDKITALFCGSKKSLVHGTVFSKILFGNSAAVGLILLPLMLFHAIQIIIISTIAGRYGKKTGL